MDAEKAAKTIRSESNLLLEEKLNQALIGWKVDMQYQY